MEVVKDQEWYATQFKFGVGRRTTCLQLFSENRDQNATLCPFFFWGSKDPGVSPLLSASAFGLQLEFRGELQHCTGSTQESASTYYFTPLTECTP